LNSDLCFWCKLNNSFSEVEFCVSITHCKGYTETVKQISLSCTVHEFRRWKHNEIAEIDTEAKCQLPKSLTINNTSLTRVICNSCNVGFHRYMGFSNFSKIKTSNTFVCLFWIILHSAAVFSSSGDSRLFSPVVFCFFSFLLRNQSNHGKREEK
jgi:hypothetical protein